LGKDLGEQVAKPAAFSAGYFFNTSFIIFEKDFFDDASFRYFSTFIVDRYLAVWDVNTGSARSCGFFTCRD
jgi:hypothetical protein